jgi:competence protein ComEC
MLILLLLIALSSLFDPPPVDINSAGKAELQSLPGVGQSTAEAILCYRETISEFLSADELIFVPGIGPATLEAIRPFVSVLPADVPGCREDELEFSTPEDTLLTVVFFDIGNGDAIGLKAGEESWLIDGGPPGEGNLRAPVVQRLRECRFDTLSAVAFTHPHADHIGGCRDALEMFRCSLLVDPGIDHPSPIYESLLQYVLDSGCSYRIASLGDVWQLSDDVRIEVAWLAREAGSTNEASAVYLVTCGNFSLLLTGDIENESIMEMTSGQTPVTVMKVPHHGSLSSLFPPWLRRARPQLAVFCCGINNPFGHPHRDVVSAWENTGSEILRTDLNGNIFLFTDGESMTFTHSRSR